MRQLIALSTLCMGLLILNGVSCQMDPEDPLVDPNMMESNGFRSGPQDSQMMQPPPRQMPQRLGTVMAMQQPSYGQQNPMYMQSSGQTPGQQQPQQQPPIMIVVPPASVNASPGGRGPSKTKRVECMLPPETGPCRGEFIRYFFDASRMSCEIFHYGGCQGNENRFTSVKACYDICSKHASTVKKPRVLSAKKVIRVTR